MTRTRDAVGSVMALSLGQRAALEGPSVWQSWTGGRAVSAFRTARGALAALIRAARFERLWLPSYACVSLLDACESAGCATAFFHVDQALRIDVAALEGGLKGGDAVLAIDYFGRPPAADFLSLVQARPDVIWIEDRAQALDTGAPAWGAYTLYSPRKLFGVADGGILVSDRPLPAPAPADPGAAARLWLPQLARFEDPAGAHPETWFPASQRREQDFAVDDAAMSVLTRAVLERTALAPEAAARRRNFAILNQYLRDCSLMPDIATPSFAPLAFPILVEDGARAHRALAAARIFCARHWPHLPSPPDAFADSHAIARRCLSIPCDGRYDEDQMHAAGQAAALTIER